ncbi:MAG TPA: EAL domain-containing protein [Candidatus Macondimonas sp.]|nr:EAL domain-containing protein [Candidatus Macondimonas sp.]
MNAHAPALLSVWIVDHAPNAAENVGSLLRNAGLRVHTRHLPDSASLVQALTGDRPDVLICPEANGPVSLEDAVARAMSYQPPIPVIALGDNPDPSRMAAVLALGAAHLVDRGGGALLAAVALREVSLTQAAQQRLILEQEATQCRSQLARFVTHTSDPMAWVAEGVHLQVNPAYARLLGYDAPTALEGNPVMDVIASASRDAVKRCLREAEQGHLPQDAIAITGRRADGSTFAMQWHLGWAQSGDQAVLQILIPAPPSDPAIEQELAQARAEGLRQQKYLAHLEQDLARIHSQFADLESRYEQLRATPSTEQSIGSHQLATTLHRLAAQPVAATGSRFLLAVHLDELPELLPSVGYVACEAAMQAYARALQALLPEGGVAVRLRDFWVAAVYTASNLKEAQTQAVRWQAQLTQQVVEIGAQSRVMRGIFGLREWPSEEETALESALLEAERAASDARIARLQVGLAKSHNPVVSTQQADAAWAERLRQALTQNSLRLVYQPISSLSGSAAEYYEVRLRMVDEGGQELSPVDFWPAAERTGIAKELDRWVLAHALRVLNDQQGDLRQKGLFVKLSGASILATDTGDWLKAHLPKIATSAPLYLEIAEEQVESNLKSVLGLSQMLKTQGYPLAIDHFGRSPHALQLASHVSPQFLKLAPGLLQEVTESQEAQGRIRQIVEHAERHDIRVIAGHVENANALAVLWQLGVHYLQGHYVQEPEVVLRSPERTSRPPPQVQRA